MTRDINRRPKKRRQDKPTIKEPGSTDSADTKMAIASYCLARLRSDHCQMQWSDAEAGSVAWNMIHQQDSKLPARRASSGRALPLALPPRRQAHARQGNDYCLDARACSIMNRQHRTADLGCWVRPKNGWQNENAALGNYAFYYSAH